MSDITIITAFFDIGRSNWSFSPTGEKLPFYIPRTTESYFEYFEYLSKMKNDMIIYCSSEHVEKINEIRKRNSPNSNTTVLSIDFKNSVANIKQAVEFIQQRPEYIKLVDDPRMPEYWNADYVVVNYMKTNFVVNAYDEGHIKTKLAAWLDFGYVRGDFGLPKSLLWDYDFDADKVHFFNKIPIDFGRPIFDIIKTNTVYIMGCHIVGGEKSWKQHKILNDISLDCLLSCGLIDDDQTILLMNYKRCPQAYELHRIEVKQEEWDNWNVAMLKFNKNV